MKSSSVGMVVSLLTLLLLESDARLLDNDLFLGPENPSAFDPELNSVVGAVEKSGVPCGVHPQKASSENTTNMLTFTFKGDGRGQVLLPKGDLADRLAKSEHSPGVGHMQVSNSAKSRQSHGTAHIEDGSKKQILNSTPSPGGGH